MDNENQKELGLKWWYAYGIYNLILVNAVLASYAVHKPVVISWIMLNTFLSISILKRDKYAFLLRIILSFNPVWWIVNGIYLKNRWRHSKLDHWKYDRKINESRKI